MNKEELIGKLQMVYVGDKNALDELIGYYDGLKQVIDELQHENKQLKDNWNKLKEFIKKSLEAIDTIQKLTGNTIENYTPRILTYKQIKNKMQELEQGSDNE